MQEVRLDHGLDQRWMAREVHRRFGIESQRKTLSLLPLFQLLSQLESKPVIAYEIVINNKHLLFPSQFQERVQFRHDLLRTLGSRLSSVKLDDVTELTLKGTAAGKLNGHRGVEGGIQKVEARHWRLSQVGLVIDRVEPLSRPFFKLLSDRVKHLIRLAHHYVISQLQQRFRIAAGVWPAHH